MAVFYTWDDMWAFAQENGLVESVCEQTQIKNLIKQLSEREQYIVLKSAPPEVVNKVKNWIYPSNKSKFGVREKRSNSNSKWITEIMKKHREENEELERLKRIISIP